MRLITKKRGIKVKKSASKVELFKIKKKTNKIKYNESPFKSITADIRGIISKKGHKMIKYGLNYAEQMKKLTKLQVEKI